jgi:hypothetical protein
VVLGVVGVLLVVLVVTGMMLIFQCRPNVSAAYGQGRGISKTLRVRTVHRDASILLLPAVGGLFIAAGGLAPARHRPARLVWPLLVGVVTVAARARRRDGVHDPAGTRALRHSFVRE